LAGAAAVSGALGILSPEARAEPVQDVGVDTTTAVIDGRTVRVTSGASTATIDLGCTGRATLLSVNRLFVACGAEGVVELDVTNPR
jgi:hypothetical protein